ncbi:glycosyltransferase (plasmid) [Sinorhizobium chiapasense]|uniref:glycosyltransferase n=1 Tax=Sinorhizobium chiapasense TaxID=501572 RepID=UPI002FDF7FF4
MLNVIAQNDLVADPNNRSVWLAEGDDPHFIIKFPPMRPRYIGIRLTALGSEIQPKLYPNSGLGFREEDALTVGTGKDFLIIADVGSFGTICSLRLDPCTEPSQLSLEVEPIRSALALEHYILEQKGTTETVILQRFMGLARFWKKFPRFNFGRQRSALATYVENASRLSDNLPPPPSDGAAPWLSIVVPVYNAPIRYLTDLTASFERQKVDGVELILSDDGSDSSETLNWLKSQRQGNKIIVVQGKVNQGIALATNAGIRAASGEWIALLDHDDVLAPNALRVILDAINVYPAAQFLYTDELVVDDMLSPIGLMLKPAYDPVLLTGVNYINHFSVYRRQRLDEIGLLRSGFDGSQDYDLLLRYLEGLDEACVIHVPFPAYWWRRTGKTYSRKFLERATVNARLAIQESFSRAGQTTEVVPALTDTLHRVRFLSAPRPKISIIIPNKDSPSLMSTLLRGIYDETDYDNFEVIIVDNGTKDTDTLALYSRYATRFSNFSFHIKEGDFNFSRAINDGVARATGEHFLLLNNDVAIVEATWLTEMVECLLYKNVGIVGAKLLYPNQRIQHVGVISGFGGLAGHWYLNKPANFGGPMNRLHVRSSMTCVTGAVMLISGECARHVGSWDEENFAVAYNDVDYCLRAYKAGFRIVWTPFACLVHHESVSRGYDRGGENRKRFEREKENLRRVHRTHEFIDPASNPGYSTDRSDPKIIPLDSLAAPRRWYS